MKCLELIHEHHTVSSADHVMCQQDSGGAAWFHFLPHCPPPSLASPALCATEDLVLILLSAGKKRHRKGTLKDHSHLYMLLAFPQQNWDASHLG